jgi:hypothetical protein
MSSRRQEICLLIRGAIREYTVLRLVRRGISPGDIHYPSLTKYESGPAANIVGRAREGLIRLGF